MMCLQAKGCQGFPATLDAGRRHRTDSPLEPLREHRHAGRNAGLQSQERIDLCHAMAPHSSTLAWKIPWMVEPGGMQSMGSLRVGPDSVTSLSLFTLMHWRRKWQPTPVFLPGESQGRELGGLPSMGSHRVGHD